MHDTRKQEFDFARATSTLIDRWVAGLPGRLRFRESREVVHPVRTGSLAAPHVGREANATVTSGYGRYTECRLVASA